MTTACADPADNAGPADDAGAAATPSAWPEPTLAEDLLLLLFQPDSGLHSGTGAIAGEGTLFYVLGGAVLTQLALDGNVRADRNGISRRVVATALVPADPLLRRAWEYVAEKPRDAQTVLAAIGPTLREPVLERVIQHGHIRRGTRTTLGVFTTRVLEGDGGSHRARLLADVRAALVDGASPSPRVAALAALVSGSGTLPQFDPEIPWTSAVATRAKALEQGDWGAGAAAEAVARTMTAIVVSSVIVATAQSRG